MVQDSEGKAQKLLRNRFTDKAYIKKIPDFKQTGSMNGGLPDYLVVNDGITRWFEIKYINTKKKSFAYKEFTNQQLIEFRKLYLAGADITIIVYFGKTIYIVSWNNVYDYIISNIDKKSIPEKEFERWNNNGI